MLRKLNFTERIRIQRSALRITLRREDDGILSFDVTLSLDALAAPPSARIYLEAYYRTSYMRFDLGTFGRISIPRDRRLKEVDSDNCVRFRLKVVDNTEDQHRIIAVAENILVCVRAPEAGGRMPLLPVNFTDLGDQPWRVDFDAGGAVLDLNNRIVSIEQQARNDPKFFALLYPTAVREILTNILLVEQHDISEDSDEWWSLWLRWSAQFVPVPVDADESDRATWIEEVVRAFCARHDVIGRLNAPSPAQGE